MISDTSLKAYSETIPERSEQREIIFNIICQATHPSSSDIARLSGIQRTSVCGRLKELENEGRIHKAKKKIDPWTKKTVYWYAPGSKPELNEH